MPRDLAHHEAHHDILQTTGYLPDAIGDQRIDVGGRKCMRIDRLEVDETSLGGYGHKTMRTRRQVVHHESLARHTMLTLVCQLAPRVAAHVIQRACIPRALCHLPMHVIVPERDVIPRRLLQLLDRDFTRVAVEHCGVLRKHALHLAVK